MRLSSLWGALQRVKKRRFMFIFPAGNALMMLTEQRMSPQKCRMVQVAVMIEFFDSGEALDNRKKYEG
jgi:hypothetical protein